MPLQLNRVAKRAALGLARLGSYSGNSVGRPHRQLLDRRRRSESRRSGQAEPDRAVPNRGIDPLFEADGAGDRGSDRQRARRGADDDRRQRHALSSAFRTTSFARSSSATTGSKSPRNERPAARHLLEHRRGFLRRSRPSRRRSSPRRKRGCSARAGRRLIGGRDRDEGRVVDARSPIDRDIILGEFPQADAALVDEAVEAARAAYPAWRDLGWPSAASRCFAPAPTCSKQRKWDVSVACLIEVGKSRLEAVGEVEEAIDLVRHYCDEMERTGRVPRGAAGRSSAERCSVVLRPYGVFGVIAPFNFPVALSVGMMSAALVAGNTVVFKPSDCGGADRAAGRRGAGRGRTCRTACSTSFRAARDRRGAGRATPGSTALPSPAPTPSA